MPFHSLKDTEISYRVIQGDRPTIPSVLNISDRLRGLLPRCWDAVYTKRPEIKEILRQLGQEETRGLVFPPANPAKLPQPPSCETVMESETHKYGATGCFRLVYSYLPAHS